MRIHLQNIYVMEDLTRLQENLRLLKMHQAQHVAAGKRTLDVELVGLRVGDFVLVHIGTAIATLNPADVVED